MPKQFQLAEETLGYVTSEDPSNADRRFLIDGSKNVMIDYQKKVKIRSGYTRLGAANTALTAIRNATTWETSTGQKWPLRFYDDELEVYIGTLDTYAVNAWKRVRSGWSTTEQLRWASWFGTTEDLDELIMVNGDDNLYAWNGAVAVVDSVTANTITKKGTTSFAENRFFTASNRTLINVRTGTEFTYTGGESTTTLTGVSGSPVTDAMVAGDILVQKVVTTADTPAANRNNHTIYSFENQIFVGSNDDEEVYGSKNSSYTDFTFSSPRVPGEGVLLTLDNPVKGFVTLGSQLLMSAGRSDWFQTEYEQIDVGGTLTETLNVKKLDTGIDQAALNQECIVPMGNSFAYLSHEVACRMIYSADNLAGIQPKALSNPIKPDFDAEDWYDSNGNGSAYGIWYKNMLIFTAPESSKMYILNFVEDADGKLFRFWNPPQILPAGAMNIFDTGTGNYYSNGDRLHFHSNSVPETYLAFDGQTDGNYDGITNANKLPIDAKAIFAYNNYGQKALLKNFDEYYVEGEITPNTTDLLMTLDYDYGGATQSIEETIDGSDETILEGTIGFNALAQQSLALNPLGGLLNPPASSRRFRVVFEESKEDFFELRTTFSSNEVDYYWAIISHGSNVELSRRIATNIRK